MEKNESSFRINFEWHSLLKDLIRNIWLVILAGVIAFLGIRVVENSGYTPTYTSSAVLVVRSKVGTTGVYSNLESSVEMAKIFTTVFKQSTMKKLAAENIGEKSFNGTIQADVTGTTNLLNISVSSKDPELSFRLLSSILEVYPDVSDTIFSDAVIDIISYPNMPTSPSNSPLTIYRNYIILFFMAFEAAMIFLFSILRETVKDEKGFFEDIDAELIGTIAHEHPHISFREKLKKKKRAMLINDAYSTLKYTEDYHKLATKFEYMRKRKEQKVFTVTSVAENEGKSTVASNIALALSERGYKVALIDLDVRKPSLYKIFDFRHELKTEFSDVLSNKATLSEFGFFSYKKSELLIAFNKKSYQNSHYLFSNKTFKQCISVLSKKMDFVIIDTPPCSVSADAVTISSFADASLLVVRTDCVAVEDINDAILSLSESDGNFAGCILNDVHKQFTLFGQMGSDETGYYRSYYNGYSKYAGSNNTDYKREIVDKRTD